MELSCTTDLRRDVVRRAAGRNGLDYVEVDDDQSSLHAYFLGKLPPELADDRTGLESYFQLSGGDVITGIRIVDADPIVANDPERDDVVVLRLDRRGDFSRYTLRLVGIDGVDPHYAAATFSFKAGCPSDVDCRPACGCEPEPVDEPRINYLAKDYASFRQLLSDRLALLVPAWKERHVPDLGVTLVELLAYAGDHLSYFQDAVATEAYLGTARQRISVRRHARLVDYRLHEGCNARAWVHVGVSADTPPIVSSEVAFITSLAQTFGDAEPSLTPAQLENRPPSSYEWFEPLAGAPTLQFFAAHDRIGFYTWGRRDCCLEKGATRATLLDGWGADGSTRTLRLAPGDVLILEEVIGARTGIAADADPSRRCAVRLVRVTLAEDPLFTVELPGGGEFPEQRPTPLVEIEWAAEDALPFSLCLSTIGWPPGCQRLLDVSVARGNVVLVDHGRRRGDEIGPVPGEDSAACCECEGQPSPLTRRVSKSFAPTLSRSPITHAQLLHEPLVSAKGATRQDPRAALPVLTLTEPDGAVWRAKADLLASGAGDRDVVVEVDNDGIAHLRFGDGELGQQPAVGITLDASYRVGNGARGNVGAESIASIVFTSGVLDGIEFTIRNPLAATGGVDPESIELAKLHAPAAFRAKLLRAITAADYAKLALSDPGLQRAFATLVWTGSWNEAVVSVDPLQSETIDDERLAAIEAMLHRYRRIGHDLRVRAAVYVPIALSLEVCAKPGYDHGHVKAALLARFVGAGGFFSPDRLSFGDGVHLSRIVAEAIGVAGVEHVSVTALRRLFAAPNGEIENGVLPLAAHEIAQLDDDPNHPERGALAIVVRGGR